MKLVPNKALIVFLTKSSYFDPFAQRLGQSGQAIKVIKNASM